MSWYDCHILKSRFVSKMGIFALDSSFAWNTLLPSSHMYMCYKIFTPLGYWVLLAKKQRLGPKLEGGWARGASKTIWNPLLIYATVEASNFKCGTQIGFGTSLAKNNM